MSYLLPRAALERYLSPALLFLDRVGVRPDHVSLLGAAGNVLAGVLAGRGELLGAGLAAWGFSALDAVDGPLARATGRQTRFGSVLDAVLDRVSEAAVLGGLAFLFLRHGDQEGALLAFVAAVASFLVSYVRARAEVVGIPLREGLLARPERVFILGLGLIINEVKVVLWVLAVAASLTAAHRLFLAHRRTRQEEEEA
ncbi:MAG: CDP-alcohol phosphatidyltransferase family protein [Dehalococcoidia bacterium]|jgi:phosphatidylglycerophosphate synthase|nr:CDP-alcohol phosphatidyltransferase family protein [Dehalococcoidia bacterium]MDW8009049.1 CDP-alcohol phosphatidyltransferase family protein [Chloroflexota bacterium]